MEPAALRACQRRLGLTQEQLAARLGVAPNTVARWERAERTMAQPHMLALALQALELQSASGATGGETGSACP
ncbi:MAG: helix-turn-helix domain-containing protein [Chloroflexota bacterium]